MISFPGLLFITFLVLKLTDVIDWSWWWVSAPLWIPLAVWAFFSTLSRSLFQLADRLERRLEKMDAKKRRTRR